MGKRGRRLDVSSQNTLAQFRDSEHQDRASHDGWLTKYLLPLGSVLIAVLTFLTQNVEIPRLAIVAAVAYLGLVAAASIYRPAVRLVLVLANTLRMARLARVRLPELDETVGQLRRLTGREHGDTVVYLIREAAQWPELKDLSPLIQDQEHLETLASWLALVDSRIADAGRNEFRGLCHEVSSLVTQYHRFCLQRQRLLQEAISSGKVAEPRLRYLKQQWNVRREGHMALIRHWVSIANKVNGMAGSKLCHDYYESLGTLE